jgi:rhodanese-related sulfurtransferase
MGALLNPEKLAELSRSFPPPLLVDLRPAGETHTILAGAIRRDLEQLAVWAPDLEIGRTVVAYDRDGSTGASAAAETLDAHGFVVHALAGGFAAAVAQGIPLVEAPTAPTRWVTRERPKIDRIACPWLIRRFIDPDAAFLYVPTAEVFATAERTGAVAYDIPGAPFAHDGALCSFDAFIAHYDLGDDPGLGRLAAIVRGADTSRLDLTPASTGLFAVSLGLSALFADDHRMLRHGLVIYDALYLWCRSLQDETHNWPPTMPGSVAA